MPKRTTGLRTTGLLMALMGLVCGAELRAQTTNLTTVMFPIRDITGNDLTKPISITPLDGVMSLQGVLYGQTVLTLQPKIGGATNALGWPVTGAMTNLVAGSY